MYFSGFPVASEIFRENRVTFQGAFEGLSWMVQRAFNAIQGFLESFRRCLRLSGLLEVLWDFREL